MNLLIGSSKHLTKGADRTVFKVVPRDTREDGSYLLPYIISVLYRDCTNTTLLGTENAIG